MHKQIYPGSNEEGQEHSMREKVLLERGEIDPSWYKIRNWTSVENQAEGSGWSWAWRSVQVNAANTKREGFLQVRRENGSLILSCRTSPMFPVVHPMIDLLGLQEKNHDPLPLWTLPDQSRTCFSAPAQWLLHTCLDPASLPAFAQAPSSAWDTLSLGHL